MLRGHAIVWFALGYFACYVPYSALTKVVSKGLNPAWGRPVSSAELLPLTVLASAIGMLVFITAMRWWRFAHQTQLLGVRLPRPTWRTFASGLSAAVIIVTTTMAYTFHGVSIVFAMVLMRGGVLVIAPLVDLLSRRKVRWFSWAALAFSLASLLVTLGDVDSYELGLFASLDIAAYLLGYFVRLRLMSHAAKSDDPETNRRFFVEEQMVAAPAALLGLAILALASTGTSLPALAQVASGFTSLWSHPALGVLLAIGLLSQGTGVFGALILLEPQENSYCVPANRISSVIAGVVASVALTFWLGEPPLSTTELAGAGLILLGIVVLSWPLLRPTPILPPTPTTR